MSKDKVKTQNEEPIHPSWEQLIDDTEREIRAEADRINKLRASVRFFRRKQAAGEPFPALSRHVPHL
jgi:hypothetical protein